MSFIFLSNKVHFHTNIVLIDDIHQMHLQFKTLKQTTFAWMKLSEFLATHLIGQCRNWDKVHMGRSTDPLGVITISSLVQQGGVGGGDKCNRVWTSRRLS